MTKEEKRVLIQAKAGRIITREEVAVLNAAMLWWSWEGVHPSKALEIACGHLFDVRLRASLAPTAKQKKGRK